MADDEVMRELVQLGCFAANRVVIGMMQGPSTGAERTHAAVEAALTTLIEQGYLSVTPQADWPPFFSPGRYAPVTAQALADGGE